MKTMKLQGNDYAKVADRMKQFREDWPSGKSETESRVDELGIVTFKAWLWKDKATVIELMKSGVTDQAVLRSSADADGDSMGQVAITAKGGDKAYEKLQTIAIGRALALLGYLGSGEIASFEEMTEFDEFKQHKHAEAVQEAIGQLNDANTLVDLKTIFMGLGNLIADPDIIAAKDARKAALMEASDEPA